MSTSWGSKHIFQYKDQSLWRLILENIVTYRNTSEASVNTVTGWG